jgi:haloalkane dehalogenase
MSLALSNVSLAAPSPRWLDRRAYPFAHHHLALAAGGMHYVDTMTKGPAILFVHGTPTWSFEYRHLIEAFASTHRCIAPDHLGFGLSTRPKDFAYTPEAHAKNLREFVHALGLREFTLVVHDFGGPIGLPLALDPSLVVDRVVLLNTWMWSFAGDAAMMKNIRFASSWLGRLLYRWFNISLRLIAPSAYGDRRKLTPAIHEQYLSVFPDGDSRERVLWTLAKALASSSAHYDGLWQERARLAAKQALVVWGMKDSAFPPTMLERLESALPKAHVVRVDDAGHWPHEEAPEQVIAALNEFMRI